VLADPDRFALGVGLAGSVDNVQDGVGVGEFVEKLVAEAPALVCAWDQPATSYSSTGTYRLPARQLSLSQRRSRSRQGHRVRA